MSTPVSTVSMTKAQLNAALISAMTEAVQGYIDVEIIDAQDEPEAYIIAVVQSAAAFAKNTRLAAQFTGVSVDE